MKQIEVYIEFARAVKSREDLSRFEIYCKTDLKMKMFFTRAEGRKFFFAFKDRKASDDFLLTAYKGFVDVGLKVEKIMQ